MKDVFTLTSQQNNTQGSIFDCFVKVSDYSAQCQVLKS